MSAFQDIIKAAVERKPVIVTGARGASPERLAVEIAGKGGPRVVFVCADARGLQRVWMNLYHIDAVYGGGAVMEEEVERPEICSRTLLFPPPLHSPYQDIAGDFTGTMARQAVLSRIAAGGDWRYLVLNAQSLLMRVPPVRETAGRVMRLAYGQEIEPHEVASELARQGYHSSGVVESPGTFASRGGSMDIFPPSSALPVRVQWYGPFVERLRLFSPETQRTGTGGEAQAIELPPVSQVPLDEERFASVTEKIRALCERQDIPTDKIRDFLDSLHLPRWSTGLGLRRFMPAFYDEMPALLELLPGGAVLLLADPEGIFEGAQRYWEDLKRDFAVLRGRDEPAYEPERISLAFESLEGEAARLRQIRVLCEASALLGGEPDQGRTGVDLGADDHSLLLRRCRGELAERSGAVSLRPLARQIRTWLDGGVGVTMTALGRSGAERLADLLGRYGIEFGGTEPGRVRLSVGPASSGFTIEGEREAFITEEEIFGKKVRGRKGYGSTTRQIEDLQTLQPGDFVVHEIHGIGRYEGQVLQTFDASTVELIKIVYRDGDILYVPVYHLNQVQKYIGGRPLSLDRLGGETFLRTKKKTKKAAYELAEKLLQLYASRMASGRKPLPLGADAFYEFEALFPYEETADQRRAIGEIMKDFDGGDPMDRLLCGDVGFGKTEVAVRAAWRVAMAGKQVAVLVPTTVLAQQHLATFRQRFADAPVAVEMLSRFQSPAARREIVRRLREGKADIVIGTHRLLSGDVHFRDLGLLIIDEEHRFGVAQKERIKFLRPSVDVLTMTATPIPRTLQMSLGKMLSLSLITTPPAHRLPIRTQVIRWSDSVIVEAVLRELDRGGQVFFLHNRVESIGKVLERLRQMIPSVRFDVAHGQMKPADLEKVMVDFVSGKVDVLVCTAIIESGLDIPNANTLFVNDVQRFGLAQLYQIRGRIGRAAEQAYAYFILPERGKLTDEARERIDALMRLTELGSGFSLATMDLEIRGAGDLLGEKQSGNIRRVGFELYCRMLEESAAAIRGEPYAPDIEPEIKMSVSAYIPEDYIGDAGLRLSFYKRMASAGSEGEIWEIIEEIEDRFGDIPPEVRTLRELMVIKTVLRRLRAYGIEAGRGRVQVHLSDRSPVSPEKLIRFVQRRRKGEALHVTPEMKVVLGVEEQRDPVALSRELLDQLTELMD